MTASKFAVFAAAAALFAGAALDAYAQSSLKAVATAETQNAAEALAAKFSGEAPPSNAMPEQALLQTAPPDAEISEESAAAAASMMAALSESARPVGDHAADNATFARQAKAAASTRKARAPQVQKNEKKIAKQMQVVRKLQPAARPTAQPAARPAAPYAAAMPYSNGQSQLRAAAPKAQEQEPGAIANVSSRTQWSLPGDGDRPPTETSIRSALQSD